MKMKELFDFIKRSPTSYHATENIRQKLLALGYTELYESDAWQLEDGRGYFALRAGSAIIAFRMRSSAKGFMITASHTDSPAFKVKISEEKEGSYLRLPTEKYGGMIMYSWLDRPLSVAGRVAVRTEDGISARLVNIDSDLLTIPSVAIHFNRGVNDGYKFNPAKDMVPLMSVGARQGTFRSVIADKLGVEPSDIISHDLFVYARDLPRLVGAMEELVLSPRLDDLACVFSSFTAFTEAKPSLSSVPVFAAFDNEEIGSATVAGANSTFLSDVLERIAGSREEFMKMIPSSLALSADNAHAIHPNAPELSDADNAPTLGGGIVIKYNSNKRYATDGVGAAVFKTLCEKAGVKTQNYYNRADIPGGSTLGAILNTQLAVPTLDIGIPELAMHSAVETAHRDDVDGMTRALKALYEASLFVRGGDVKIQ